MYINLILHVFVDEGAFPDEDSIDVEPCKCCDVPAPEQISVNNLARKKAYFV